MGSRPEVVWPGVNRVVEGWANMQVVGQWPWRVVDGSIVSV